MRAAHRVRRSAFTVLQLIVVLAILLFLLGLMVPAVQKVRQAAARTQSMNNMKQLALAMHGFHDANKAFPPAVGEINGQTGPTHFHILPYVEQNALYNAAQGASWKNGTYGHVIPTFLDPADSSLPGNVYKNWLGTTNYAVNWLVTKEGKMSIVQITDGASNTLMFAQRYQICNEAPTAWGYPSFHTWAPMFAYYNDGKFQSAPPQDRCDPTLPQALGRSIQVALCDGSVRSISEAISPFTWASLTDPSDGQPLPGEAFD
jgi:type II secretory pathway pseudopilin PulG